MKLSIAINLLFTIAAANAKIRAGGNVSKYVVPADSDASADNFEDEEGGKLCTRGFIPCDNGFVSGSGSFNGQTCADACEGACCVGDDACTGFTGTLCKDNGTCKGKKACFNGHISALGKSCDGDSACEGTILPNKVMKNSCGVDMACCFATESTEGADNASEDSEPGKFIYETNGINFENSCDDTQACDHAIFATTNVDGCCNNANSCKSATVHDNCATATASADDSDEADLAGPDGDNAVKVE